MYKFSVTLEPDSKGSGEVYSNNSKVLVFSLHLSLALKTKFINLSIFIFPFVKPKFLTPNTVFGLSI